MEIRKDSWHYKLWTLTYLVWGFEVPEKKSLCRYIGRIVSLPVHVLFMILVVILALSSGIMALGIILPLALFLGYSAFFTIFLIGLFDRFIIGFIVENIKG